MRKEDTTKTIEATDICLAWLGPLLHAALEDSAFFEIFINTLQYQSVKEPSSTNTVPIPRNSLRFFTSQKGPELAVQTGKYLAFLELLRKKHHIMDEQISQKIRLIQQIDDIMRAVQVLVLAIKDQYDALILLAHSYDPTLSGDNTFFNKSPSLTKAYLFLKNLADALAKEIIIPKEYTQKIESFRSQSKAFLEKIKLLKTELYSLSPYDLDELNPFEYNPPNDLQTLLTIIQRIAAEPNSTQIHTLLYYLKIRPNITAFILENSDMLHAMAQLLFNVVSQKPQRALKLIPSYLCPKKNLPPLDKNTTDTQREYFKSFFTRLFSRKTNQTNETIDCIQNLMGGKHIANLNNES